MGTRYVRDVEIPSEFIIETGQLESFEIAHIYSELFIGNELEINLRQVSSHSFITMQRDMNKTVVTIEANDVEAGEYEFEFESYDGAS